MADSNLRPRRFDARPAQGPQSERERDVAEASAGGSAGEALAGLGAVVLAILALAGVLVFPLAAIAVIAAGAALVFEGGAFAARVDAAGHEPQRAAMVGGIGADTLSGVAAMVLGVLALIGIAPMVLLPASAIVLGAGTLLSTAAPAAERGRLRHVGGREEEMVRRGLGAASGVHTLVGGGALVLGILALATGPSLVLTLVAVLVVGAGLLLSGLVMRARMLSAARAAGRA